MQKVQNQIKSLREKRFRKVYFENALFALEQNMVTHPLCFIKEN